MTPLPIRLLLRLRPQDSPLAGDLFEEFGKGRPMTWLWKQVLMATFLGAIGDARRNRTDALRGIAVLGFCALAVPPLVEATSLPMAWWMFGTGSVFPSTSGTLVQVAVLGGAASVAFGWAAARAAGQFRRMVLVALVVLGLASITARYLQVGRVMGDNFPVGALSFETWALTFLSLTLLFLSAFSVGGWLSTRPADLGRARRTAS
jgi:hypothetical protein